MATPEQKVQAEAEAHESGPEAEAGRKNLSEMSDEEILTLDVNGLMAGDAEPAKAVSEELDEGNDPVEAGGAADEDKPSEEEAESVEAPVEASEEVDPFDGPEPKAASKTKDDQSLEKDQQEELESQESKDFDYKAGYEELMAPFKAAKREIKLDNIDDARRLMQMGVDYNRKMQILKPYQKVLKTLEKNKLLDESRLNFLIDLDKGKPEAIQRLLTDKKVDPLSLSDEESSEYKPTDHMMDDRELAFNEVMDELRDSPTFVDTMEAITKNMDTASRQVLVDTPPLIRILDEHMQHGIFNKIQDAVASERLMGRLVGLSDLEAYKAVGDRMLAAGEFANSKPQRQGRPDLPPNQDSAQDSKPVAKSQVKDRKRAASPPKGTASGKRATPDLNRLSDEEVLNLNWQNL